MKNKYFVETKIFQDLTRCDLTLVRKENSTFHAPAKRADKNELMRQAELFKNRNYMGLFLSKLPVVFFIVNKQRQIVYMNKGALEFSGLEEFVAAEGQRPGELFGCIHARTTKGGCGTTKYCTYCGAVNAVLESQSKGSSVKDARLILGPEKKAFDLRIWASQFKIEGYEFTAVTIQDISHEKRREILERVLLHDIANHTSKIVGMLGIVSRLKPKEKEYESYIKNLEISVNNLMDKIKAHRLINMAENNNLEITPEKVKTLELLKELVEIYNISDKKTIKIKSNITEITTDRTIVQRIISNMLTNAIEASENKAIITLGCNEVQKKVEFWVHNPEYIPQDIQDQIFNRSFSTKGKNRGLGTYSMKLLASFLGGTVKFNSSKEKGTTFSLLLPNKMESQ